MVNIVTIPGLSHEWNALNHLQSWVAKNAKGYFDPNVYIKAEGCVRDGLVTLGSVRLGTIEGTVSDGNGLSCAITLVRHQNLMTASCNCVSGRAGRSSARQAAINGNAEAPQSCHHLVAFLMWAAITDNKASLSAFVCGGATAFSYKGYLATYKSREELIEMLDKRSSTCEKRDGMEEYTASVVAAVSEEDPPIIALEVETPSSATTAGTTVIAPKREPATSTKAAPGKGGAAPKNSAVPKKVAAVAKKSLSTSKVASKTEPAPKAVVSAASTDQVALNKAVSAAAPKRRIVIETDAPAELETMFKDARELINDTWSGEHGGPGENGTDLGPELQGIFARSIPDYFTTHPHRVRLQLCGLIEYLHYADLCADTGYDSDGDDEEDELNSFSSNDVCEIFIDFVLSQPEDQQPHILKEFIDVEQRHIGDRFFEFNFVKVILKYYMADGSVKSPQLIAFLKEEEKRDRNYFSNTPRPPDAFSCGYEGSSVQAEVVRVKDAYIRGFQAKQEADERERESRGRNSSYGYSRSSYYHGGNGYNNYYYPNRGNNYNEKPSWANTPSYNPVTDVLRLRDPSTTSVPAVSPGMPASVNNVSVPQPADSYNRNVPSTTTPNNSNNNIYLPYQQVQRVSAPPTPIAAKPTTTLIRPRLSQ